MSGIRIIDDANGDGVTAGQISSSATGVKPCFVLGASGQGIYVCTGTPLGAITANIGSIALRIDGGAATSFYVKESGNGANTGWVAK